MSDLYKIVQVDGKIRETVGRWNTYGFTPKIFTTKESAMEWILNHSYKGMSFKYEIEKA